MAKKNTPTLGGARLRKNRNRFVALTESPTARMSSSNRPPVEAKSQSTNELQPVIEWFLSQEMARERFAWTLRDSLDELLDGERTGRWCYQHLKKAEKTHLGTAVEVNFTKEFELRDGDDLDWQIAGVDVDCKFSKDYGGWEIPMEMYHCADHGEQSGIKDQIALLLWMNDDESQWAAGITKIEDLGLKFKQGGQRQYNRDNKRKLNDQGLAKVHWLWGGLQTDLPQNLIRHMDDEVRTKVLSDNSGQRRVNELFRQEQKRIITRATVLTVAQQDDSMKRARDARLSKHLGGEGYLILGHQDAHPQIAALLGLAIPTKGEFVSCRIVKTTGEWEAPKVFLDGCWWRLANGESDNNKISPAPNPASYKKASAEQLEFGEP